MFMALPTASDNPFPSILLEDHVDPAAPSSGFHRLFIDTDEKLKMIDHASLVTDFTPSGGLLNKYDATAAPGVGDDSGDGYAVGSIWIDVTGDKAYIAVDVTVGAAVWNPFEAAGAGDAYSDHIGAHADIVAYYRLNEAPGSTTYVEYNGGTSLTVTAGITPVCGGPSLVGDATGGSLAADWGTSTLVKRAAITLAKPWTLEAWCIMVPHTGAIAAQFTNTGAMLYNAGVGNISGFSSANARVLVTTGADHYGRHHLVMTCEADGTSHFYNNGTQVGADLASGLDFPNTSFCVGAYNDGAGDGVLSASISDVAVYNTALSAVEVDDHWDLGNKP
jgi:hypothetical protein